MNIKCSCGKKGCKTELDLELTSGKNTKIFITDKTGRTSLLYLSKIDQEKIINSVAPSLLLDEKIKKEMVQFGKDLRSIDYIMEADHEINQIDFTTNFIYGNNIKNSNIKGIKKWFESKYGIKLNELDKK